METQTDAVQKFALYALSDITRKGAFSKSHLYNMLARGQFPQPTLRWARFTRWNAAEVDRWLADPQAWIDANASVAA